MQSRAIVPVKQVKTVKAAPQAKAVKTAPQAKAVKPAAKKDTLKTHPVTFTAHAAPGSKVFLAGSFNNWDPAAVRMADNRGDGVFSATLNLPEGEHHYKYVIDGAWSADRLCPDWAPNEHGTLNSVKRVF